MAVSIGTSDVLIGVAQHDASALEGLFQARLDNLEASGLDPEDLLAGQHRRTDRRRCRPGLVRVPGRLRPRGRRHPRGDPWACWSRSTPRSAMSASCRRAAEIAFALGIELDADES